MTTRREFLKSSAMLSLSTLIPGCSSDALRSSGLNSAGYLERTNKMKRSAFYNGETFINMIKTDTGLKPGKAWEAVSKWITGDEVREPPYPIPTISADINRFISAPSNDLKIIWLGHSSLLIEIEGQRILIDPVWSERCSPISFLGPKRFYSVPFSIAQLPKIDAVLISHDHYDHLDESTIRILAKQRVNFYVPLGIGNSLIKWGVSESNIIEMDWWDMIKTRNQAVSFIATPARHYGGRGLFQANKSFWCSWCIIGRQHRLFYSGDTGVLPIFEDIGKTFGPFDFTFLDIGAYDSCWADIHMSPEQAIEVHRHLNGKVLMPIHWGTFKLAYHSWNDPVLCLTKEAEKKSIPVVIPKPGRMVTMKQLPSRENWWLNVNSSS